MLIAIALLAGAAAANPLALVAGEGGGEAAGAAEGDYYVDASDGLDTAYEEQAKLSDDAQQTVRDANSAYTEAKHRAWADASSAELPQQPSCQCDELANQLEQAGNAQIQHADRVEKTADLDTEVVDAGADVGAAAQAKAWFSDVFEGASDAFDEVRGPMGHETQLDDEAEQIGDSAIGADDEIRGELVHQLQTEQDLPKPDPRVDGSFAAEHATSVATSAAGQATGAIDAP